MCTSFRTKPKRTAQAVWFIKKTGMFRATAKISNNIALTVPVTTLHSYAWKKSSSGRMYFHEI
jgi:glycopeptide antibiotics resistance protein